jgi:hypothetical protein
MASSHALIQARATAAHALASVRACLVLARAARGLLVSCPRHRSCLRRFSSRCCSPRRALVCVACALRVRVCVYRVRRRRAPPSCPRAAPPPRRCAPPRRVTTPRRRAAPRRAAPAPPPASSPPPPPVRFPPALAPLTTHAPNQQPSLTQHVKSTATLSSAANGAAPKQPYVPPSLAPGRTELTHLSQFSALVADTIVPERVRELHGLPTAAVVSHGSMMRALATPSREARAQLRARVCACVVVRCCCSNITTLHDDCPRRHHAPPRTLLC